MCLSFADLHRASRRWHSDSDNRTARRCGDGNRRARDRDGRPDDQCHTEGTGLEPEPLAKAVIPPSCGPTFPSTILARHIPPSPQLAGSSVAGQTSDRLCMSTVSGQDRPTRRSCSSLCRARARGCRRRCRRRLRRQLRRDEEEPPMHSLLETCGPAASPRLTGRAELGWARLHPIVGTSASNALSA